MYSVISNLTIASSWPKRISAKVLASSVLPTPVGPRKTKLPIGLWVDFKPALPRLTAWATAVTAASWSIRRSCMIFSRLANLSTSLAVIFETGIPVQREMISFMISTVTSVVVCDFFRLYSSCFSLRTDWVSSIFDLNIRPLTLSPVFSVSFSSWFNSAILVSTERISSGSEIIGNLTADDASSIRSTALSGRKRSPI